MMEKLLVRDLMTEDVLAVQAGDSLATVSDLMVKRRIRHVPVIDGDGLLVGLVSQRDLLRNSLIEQIDVPQSVERAVLERLEVRDLMVTEVDGIGPSADVREAAQLMLEHKYGCLPVVEGRRLVGILTEADFVRLFASGQ